jgi:transcriptional regulator with GAF, ATPase, and Fis domain
MLELRAELKHPYITDQELTIVGIRCTNDKKSGYRLQIKIKEEKNPPQREFNFGQVRFNDYQRVKMSLTNVFIQSGDDATEYDLLINALAEFKTLQEQNDETIQKLTRDADELKKKNSALEQDYKELNNFFRNVTGTAEAMFSVLKTIGDLNLTAGQGSRRKVERVINSMGVVSCLKCSKYHCTCPEK